MKEEITSTKSASRICYETPWLALSGRGRAATLQLSSSAVELRSFLMGLGLNQDHRLQGRFFSNRLESSSENLPLVFIPTTLVP